MSYTNKTLEELNVLDDFLMNAIVTTPVLGEAFCRSVLTMLLQRKINKINIISQRIVPPFTPDLRGIRMDWSFCIFIQVDTEAEMIISRQC